MINYLHTQSVPDLFRTVIGLVLSIVEKPIMQLTVKEYLWGYEDTILKVLKNRLPQLVTNDQVSVFGSVVRIRFFLNLSHCLITNE